MKLKNMTLISLFAALTAIGSYIYIPLPFSPVPVTLQLLFALLAGGLLGKKLGILSQLIYLLLGVVGLPVFAGGMGGIGAVFGPTGGYLLGFLPAAYLAGKGQKKFRSKILYLFTGLLIIYLSGITGLMLNTGLTFKKAIINGVLPFLPGDIFKVILANYLITKVPTGILN